MNASPVNVGLGQAARALLKERQQTSSWSSGKGSHHAPALVPGGVAHTEGSRLTVLDEKGQVRWQADLGAEASAPAASADGRVYACSRDGHLHAFGPDGAPLWQREVPVDGDKDPAVGPDGTVYVVDSEGRLHGFTPEGGERFSKRVKPLLDFGLDKDMYTSPVVGADGTVLVANKRKYLQAFHADGSRAWRTGLKDELMTGPTVAPDGSVAFGTFLSTVVRVDAKGRQEWSRDLGGSAISSAPAFGPDGSLYVGDSDNRLVGFDRWGKQTWVTRLDSKPMGTPAVASDGTVYAPSWFGTLYAMKPGSQAPLWTARVGGLAVSSPRLADDGTLYVNTAGGSLTALRERRRDGTAEREALLEEATASAPAAPEPSIESVDGWIMIGDVRLPVQSA